ncbi:patatin-like phospholipase family protein [Neisseria sp.]|uniref:patatin-like phospholipase family protein n=1 Tax=Neisseria sp. TaxID=192066 RepID=UPI0035A19A67
MSAKRLILFSLTAALLSACSLVRYQPLETISDINRSQGYRAETVKTSRYPGDDTLVIMMFSGGGTRAAALGYGVLEELKRQKVYINGREQTLLDSVDIVTGVSGGSVLAAYFALHGKDAIPAFERRFLKQNFQRQMTKQIFSAANLPRLASPEFGRGDLLQEQFDSYLFKHATFADLEKRRKGPFAIISATDMGLGEHFIFTQEQFDVMCLNLGRLKISRAVAASSSVPMVFSPITLNNNGGRCNYTPPPLFQTALPPDNRKLQQQTANEFADSLYHYENSSGRPYIHLVDGGLTDNLGLRALLDVTELQIPDVLLNKLRNEKIKRIVVVSVNARREESGALDKTAAVPGLGDVIGAIINIPIDKFSQESLRRFRILTDQWNEAKYPAHDGTPIKMHFVSLNLLDLPPSPLRNRVAAIPTTFYLPPADINDLKNAGKVLLNDSAEYRSLTRELSFKPQTADTEALLNSQPQQADSAQAEPKAQDYRKIP